MHPEVLRKVDYDLCDEDSIEKPKVMKLLRKNSITVIYLKILEKFLAKLFLRRLLGEIAHLIK